MDSQRLRQYEPSELYYQPDSSRIVKLNGDSSMYNVKKRDYLGDLKTGRDTQYQVVLDPKSRQPVAVIDNQVEILYKAVKEFLKWVIPKK